MEYDRDRLGGGGGDTFNRTIVYFEGKDSKNQVVSQWRRKRLSPSSVWLERAGTSLGPTSNMKKRNQFGRTDCMWAIPPIIKVRPEYASVHIL